MAVTIRKGGFEWDAAKHVSNAAKHGVGFFDALTFDFATALTVDQQVGGETRYKSIGWIGTRLHVMIWTWRDTRLRVISLRKASSKEVRLHASHARRGG